MSTEHVYDVLEELTKPENFDITQELTDARFFGRRHGSRSAYANGCTGPLCRKRERDRGRERNRLRAESLGRTYIPGRSFRIDDRDDLLEQVLIYHEAQLEEIKEKKKRQRAAERIKKEMDRRQEEIALLAAQYQELIA